MEAPKVSFEGTLEKTSGVFKSKTKVWMVLHDLSLTYYKNHKRSSCIGSIDMATVQSVTQKKHMGGGKKFQIITATNTYHFEAENSEMCEAWVKVLRQSLTLKSTLSGSEINTSNTEETKTITSSGTSRKGSSSFYDELETLPSSPTVFGVKLKSTRHSRKSRDSQDERVISSSSPKSPASTEPATDKPKSNFPFGHIDKRMSDSKDGEKNNMETYNKIYNEEQSLHLQNKNDVNDSTSISTEVQIDKDSDTAKYGDALSGSTKVTSDVEADKSDGKETSRALSEQTNRDSNGREEILLNTYVEEDNLRGMAEKSSENINMEKQNANKYDCESIITDTNVERHQEVNKIAESIAMLESNSVDGISANLRDNEIKVQTNEANKSSDGDKNQNRHSPATAPHSNITADADIFQSVKAENAHNEQNIDNSLTIISNLNNDQSYIDHENKHPIEANNYENEIMMNSCPLNNADIGSTEGINENVADEINMEIPRKDDETDTIKDSVSEQIKVVEVLTNTDDVTAINEYIGSNNNEKVASLDHASDDIKDIVNSTGNERLNERTDGSVAALSAGAEKEQINETVDSVKDPLLDNETDNEISEVQMRKSGRDTIASKTCNENIDEIDISQVVLRKSSRSRSGASYRSAADDDSENQTDIGEARKTDTLTKLDKLRSLKESLSLSVSGDSEVNIDTSKTFDESEDIDRESKLENLKSVCGDDEREDLVFTEEASTIKLKENHLCLEAYDKLTAFVKQTDRNYDAEYHRLNISCPVTALEEMLSSCV